MFILCLFNAYYSLLFAFDLLACFVAGLLANASAYDRGVPSKLGL